MIIPPAIIPLQYYSEFSKDIYGDFSVYTLGIEYTQFYFGFMPLLISRILNAKRQIFFQRISLEILDNLGPRETFLSAHKMQSRMLYADIRSCLKYMLTRSFDNMDAKMISEGPIFTNQ
jgi:hypothetical protein